METDEQRYAMAASLIGPSTDTQILNDLLQICTKRVSGLSAILIELERSRRAPNAFTRKWNMVKVAFRGTDMHEHDSHFRRVTPQF